MTRETAKMRNLCSSLVFLICLVQAYGSEFNQGLRIHPQRHKFKRILRPLPNPKKINIPDEFDWGKVTDAYGRYLRISESFALRVHEQEIKFQDKEFPDPVP